MNEFANDPDDELQRKRRELGQMPDNDPTKAIELPGLLDEMKRRHFGARGRAELIFSQRQPQL